MEIRGGGIINGLVVTSSGTYKLVGDVVFGMDDRETPSSVPSMQRHIRKGTPLYCITITADNVTLDLGGRTLSVDPKLARDHAPISMIGIAGDNVKVTNGKIRHSHGHSVYVLSTLNVTIETMSVDWGDLAPIVVCDPRGAVELQDLTVVNKGPSPGRRSFRCAILIGEQPNEHLKPRRLGVSRQAAKRLPHAGDVVHVDATRGSTRRGDPDKHVLVTDLSFVNQIDRTAALCFPGVDSALSVYDVSNSNVLDVVDPDSTIVFEGTVPVTIINSGVPPENIVLSSPVFVG